MGKEILIDRGIFDMTKEDIKTLLMIITTLIVPILSLVKILPFIKILFVLIYICICFFA